ncbi:MAG: retropepsin-like aspartic protease [Rhizomicrobium sp.]
MGCDGPVSFLVDTGADCTVLMPTDAAKLGVDFTKLTVTEESLGFGGIHVDYLLPAIVMVADNDEHDGTAYGWKIDLRIAAPKPELMSIPSVLGRDVLQHWCLTLDKSKGLLEAEVRHSDAKSKL